MTYIYVNQEIEYLREPVQAIIIRNMCGKALVKRFVKHMRIMHASFTHAGVSKTDGSSTVDKSLRSNQVMYMTNVFPEITKSILGKHLIEAIQSNWIHQLVGSSFSPVFDLAMTNFSEIQVSRYGDSKEHYDWHQDRINNNNTRWLSLVYYFWKEPKQFTGGQLGLTDGLTVDGKLVEQKPKPKIYKLTPENDMGIMFSSRTPHCVFPTSSPKTFIDGRFSVNMWIGYKQT